MSSTARPRAVLGVPLLDVVLAGLVVALSIGGLISGVVDETPVDWDSLEAEAFFDEDDYGGDEEADENDYGDEADEDYEPDGP